MSPTSPRYDGPLRVLVVDADDRVRESLTGLLAIGGRCMVVASAGQVGPALELAIDHQPDVVILDPRLPEVDGGMALIARLRAQLPNVRILAMSWSDTLEAGVLESGADGFVRKTFRPTELVAAVIAAGRAVDSPASEPA
jgi:two-component system NarL family response regulator/two-component system response regulator DevR